jgi:hypothetical protein
MADADQRSETISEFCVRERISRATFFKLQRAGLGPKTVRFFNVVRITAEARQEWHARIAELNHTQESARERLRRIELARSAGRAAAKSPLHVSNRASGRARRKAGANR